MSVVCLSKKRKAATEMRNMVVETRGFVAWFAMAWFMGRVLGRVYTWAPGVSWFLVCVCVCVFVCVCMDVCICMCMYACMHVCMYVCM